MVSAFAHALAAVTVTVVLRSLPRAPVASSDAVVDIDVAPVVDAPADQPVPPVEAPRPVDNQPVPRRGAPMSRSKAPVARPGAGVAGPSIAPDPAEAEQPARFALSTGTVATRMAATAVAPAGSPGNGVRSDSNGDAPTVGERDVNVPARLLSASPLVYPPVARQAELELDLPVEIVVDVTGRVAGARVLSRVGYGLDEAALRAIREYRFSPALRAGRPVAVRMRWTVQFRLR